MIGRWWKTGLKPGRGEAYDTFAREISLPMFQGHAGFLGCVMFRDETEASVLTLWRDLPSVTALEASPSYRATVTRILQADLVAAPQSVSMGEIHLLDLAAVAGTLSSAESRPPA